MTTDCEFAQSLKRMSSIESVSNCVQSTHKSRRNSFSLTPDGYVHCTSMYLLLKGYDELLELKVLLCPDRTNEGALTKLIFECNGAFIGRTH